MGHSFFSMTAAWLNFVNGSGGMRSDGQCLSFSLSLTARWKNYQFRVL